MYMYMYMNIHLYKLCDQAKQKVVKKKHIVHPTGVGADSSACCKGTDNCAGTKGYHLDIITTREILWLYVSNDLFAWGSSYITKQKVGWLLLFLLRSSGGDNHICVFSSQRFMCIIKHAGVLYIRVLKPLPGSLFTKRTDVLQQDLVKSWSCEIRVKTVPIALKFDRHIDSSAAEMPVKFQNDMIILKSNLAALRLHEICQ